MKKHRVKEDMPILKLIVASTVFQGGEKLPKKFRL